MKLKLLFTTFIVVFFSLSIKSQCSGVQVAPYTYGFEDQTVPTPGTAFNGYGLLNNCWTASPSDGGTTFTTHQFRLDSDGTGSGNITVGPSEGSVYAYAETSSPSSSGDSAFLTSPLIDIAALTSPEMLIDYHAERSNYNLLIQVRMQNGNWVNTDTVIGGGQSASSPWRENTTDLSAFSGIIQVRFISVAPGCCDDLGIDNIRIRNTPTCPALLFGSLATSGISSNSIDLSWTAVGSPTSFTIRYAPSSTPTNFTTITGVSASPYTLMNLNVAETYNIEVRAECGPNDSSDWRSINATTSCGVFPVPYLGNFSQFTGSIPNPCWRESSSGNWATGPTGGSTGNWSLDGFQNNGTTGAARVDMLFTTQDWMVSAPIAIPSSPVYELRYGIVATDFAQMTLQNALMEADDTVAVMISNDFGNNWFQLKIYSAGMDSVPAFPTRERFDLSGFAGDTIMIGFYADIGAGFNSSRYEVFIDDVEVNVPSTCPEPSITNVSQIRSFGAQVDWTSLGSANAWQVLTVPVGLAPNLINGNLTNATSTSTFVAGLNGSTDYEVYVRSICGPGDTSIWSFARVFSTPCNPTIPAYFWNFNANLTDMCWELFEMGDITTGPIPPVANFSEWTTSIWLNAPGGTSSDAAATVNLFGTFVNDQWLVTGDFDLSATDYELSFLVGMTEFNTQDLGVLGSDDEVYLLISNDYGDNWSVLEKWDAQNSPNNLGEERYYNLSNYTGDTVRFAFYASTGAVNDPEDNDFFINDFRIDTLPDCPDPFAFELDRLNSTSADLSWSVRTPTPQFEVQYGPAGFTPGLGLSQITNTNSITISPLNPSTTYEAYVRALCGGMAGNSIWRGPITFTTNCGVLTTLPWDENFDTMTNLGQNILPDCWNFAGNIASDSGMQLFNRMPQSGNNYITMGSDANNWAILPGFNLSAGNVYELKYSYTTDGFNGWAFIRANYGTHPLGSAMTNSIGVINYSPSNTTYVNVTDTFVSSISGEAYIGINVFSNINPRFLSLDDFSLSLVSVSSVEELNKGKDVDLFNIFPNPNNGEFTLSNLSSENQEVDIHIYDLQGKMVFNRKVNMSTKSNELIDIPDVTTGMYIVNIQSGNHSENHKIVIRK